MTTRFEKEKQRAHAVADEYRRKGYEVIEAPTFAQLPDFLAGYQPDLLARKGNEAVIVEVKARSSLGKSPQIQQLAKLLREKAGWKFDLVIVGEPGKLDLPEDAHLLSKVEILQLMAISDNLRGPGRAEAALVLLWSALEAAIRRQLEEEDPYLSFLDSAHILNHAVVYGVLSRDHYNKLMKVWKLRNAVAHGFKIHDLQFSMGYSIIKSTVEDLLELEAES